MIFQQIRADDFVIATGERYSVKEFVEAAFQEVGIEVLWEREGIAEKEYDNRGKYS